jgi:hypothetical protein
MHKKVSFAPRIAFALFVLVTLGCGASARATSIEAAESAATEVVVTDSDALPDMSVARIIRRQLPARFEEIEMDDVGKEGAPFGQEEFLPEEVFAYVNKSDFHVIIGMNFLLTDAFNELGFGATLEDPETLMEFAGAMGGENIREEKVLDTLEDLGEKRSAMTMLADVEGVPMRVNAAMFQRGVIGGIILSMTVEGQEAQISFEKLTRLFDERVQESLEGAQ